MAIETIVLHNVVIFSERGIPLNCISRPSDLVARLGAGTEQRLLALVTAGSRL